MSPATLLTTLRCAGVVLEVKGDHLRFDAPRETLTSTMREEIARHRTAILDLVRETWWPADSPRPNLYDLGEAYGAETVRGAFLDLGCDVNQRTPSWEELFVVATALAAVSPVTGPTSPASAQGGERRRRRTGPESSSADQAALDLGCDGATVNGLTPRRGSLEKELDTTA